MKIGILTYHFSDNYGALFQAYAMREWLLQRGFEANFVNYHPKYVEEGGQFDRPWRLSLWRKNATILYMKQAHLRRKLFGDHQQKKLFDNFRTQVLGVSGQRLLEINELAPVVADYDMLLCGSDQIWNPSVQRGLDPVYFLNIPGSESLHKVAFAPSFGRGEIEPRYNATLRRLVSKLDGVSVREDTGIDILERAGFPPSHVQVMPDPTILLGNFDGILGGVPRPNDSVFCYALRTDEAIRGVALEAARLTGGTLQAPRTMHQRWSDIGEGTIPGPVEWLQTLACAGLVISNSFHGVALSVVLNRPFIAVRLPGKRANLNARVQNLLEVVGLSHRFVDPDNPRSVQELIKDPIDWCSVNARLASVRADAETYLNAHIETVSKQRNRCSHD